MSTQRILIAYATTHGQTAMIAARLQRALEQRGLDVVVANVKTDTHPSLDQFQGVMVGASIIAGGHQPAVASFIRHNLAALNGMPSAFFSVSASAGSAMEKGRSAARHLREAFLVKTGFRPRLAESIAGAIKYTRYNFLLRWYMKKASRMNGGSTDTTRDHEYTDWNQVEAFARAFADLVMSTVNQEVLAGAGALREPPLQA